MTSRNIIGDAIVFVPGIGPSWDGENTVDELGIRILTALERNYVASDQRKIEFTHEVFTQDFGDIFGNVRTFRISYQNSNETNNRILIDLYVLDLPELQIRPYRMANVGKRVLKLGWQLATLIPKVFRLFLNIKSKGFRSNLQLVSGAATVLLMLLILVILVATLITGIASLGTENLPEQLKGYLMWSVPIAGAVLGFLNILPNRLRSAIDGFSNLSVAFVDYVQAGARRNIVEGHLASFIDTFKRHCEYQRVHIVSYSLGSLMVLDSVFPITSPAIGRLKSVDTLVTIGCPGDLLHTYWPSYFTQRHRLNDVPKRWLNFFNPSDIFGSNFIKGDNETEKPYCRQRKLAGMNLGGMKKSATWSGIQVMGSNYPIVPDNIRYPMSVTSGMGRLDYIMAAIRAHQVYWDRSDHMAASVFDVIVRELFPELENSS